MNYFAHAIRFLDRPWFVCGVSVPDWLNVVDRQCRVRRKSVAASLESLQGEDREIGLGILQHLDDDHWFHNTASFIEANNSLARSFRENLGSEGVWHCGFLGHIVLELLIDAELIARNERAIHQYYENFREIDAKRVADVVSALATKPADDLARLLPLFVKERFLFDYLDNDRLRWRLNQVMKRVSLPPLPESVVDVFDEGRQLVSLQLDQLVPEGSEPPGIS